VSTVLTGTNSAAVVQLMNVLVHRQTNANSFEAKIVAAQLINTSVKQSEIHIHNQQTAQANGIYLNGLGGTTQHLKLLTKHLLT